MAPPDLHELLDTRRVAATSLPTRMTMRKHLSASDPAPRRFTTRFWRNTAVEHLFVPLEFFLHLADLAADTVVTGYDDALAFTDLASTKGDVEIIVIERDRLSLDDAEFDSWSRERADWLRRTTGNVVIVVVVRASSEPTLAISIDDEMVWSLDDPEAIDTDATKGTGSVLSAKGFGLLARELGLTWLPAARGAIIKLLAVDLDETLHSGILGEIGLDVVVTDGHRALQQELLDAKQRGLMLALVSKNDRADVLELLEAHPDYLLSAEDFVAIEASWDAKAVALRQIIDRTHIGADAAVFIDDNFAELAQAHASVPGLVLVSCETGPYDALATLRHTPGHRTFRSDSLGDVRRADILSDEERSELLRASLESYLRTAEPRVTFHRPSPPLVERLADLCARSNQFNVTLTRSTADRFEASLGGETLLVGVEVSDRFSESGIVAGALGRREGDRVVVDELFMSCRVLGRGLEDSIMCGALSRLAEFADVTEVEVPWVRGPRNEPALTWLARHDALGDAEGGTVRFDRAALRAAAEPPTGVSVDDEG